MSFIKKIVLILLVYSATVCTELVYAAKESAPKTTEHLSTQIGAQNEVYKKYLLWRVLGSSLIAATGGTFAVTLLDSLCSMPTYAGNESVKWWLTYLVGSGFGTFYALCQETWPELGSKAKAYYIVRLILYYAALKGTYAALKLPVVQHYFIDDVIEIPAPDQHEELFNASGAITFYKLFLQTKHQ